MRNFFFGFLLLIVSVSVSAQECGFAACEITLAAEGSNPATLGAQCLDNATFNNDCVCVKKPTGHSGGCNQATGVGIELTQIRKSTGVVSYGCPRSFADCNCTARPDLPATGPDAVIGVRPGGKRCVDGCLFKAKEPMVTFGDSNGKHWGSSQFGWTNDGGAQCNSFTNDPDENGPGPDPVECDESGEACSQAPEPPEFCGEINGVKMCVGNPGCEGNMPTGYICVGPPEDMPKPPAPPDGPDPDTPPVLEGPCVINGLPCKYEFYKPPYPERPCPEGTHREGNACVANPPVLCPNGEPPVNGTCPAPPAQCPDGTQPVEGRCVAPWTNCPNGSPPVNGTCAPVEGVCPGGGQPVLGVCPAQLGTCPDGSTPTNGTCPVGYANCPNGQRPVNGVCPVGTPCNPETDPDNCEGANEGNASGGQTCSAAPACSGDSILCAVLNQQWRTRCAMEGTAAAPGDPRPAMEALGNTNPWGPDEVFEGGGLGTGSGFDDSGMGLSRTCPSIPPFVVMGTTVEIPQVWCGLLEMMGTLLLVGASWVATKIVASA